MEEERAELPLEERNRVLLAYMNLSKDKKFTRLSEEKRIKLIRFILSFADSCAGGIKEEFGTADPRRIVETMGLKVVGEDGGIRGSLVRRSEYRPGTKEIVIYRDSLNQMMKEVKAEDLQDRLIKLLIAHELFHHLEKIKLPSVPKMFRVEKWRLGPMSLGVKIRGVREVAAHAFAEALLEIKHSPMVFDYLTYIFYSGRGRG